MGIGYILCPCGATKNRAYEQCHALVDADGAVRNDPILAEPFGIGAGRYAFTGNWAFVAGGNNLELFDFKQDGQLIAGNRFPGIIVNGSAADRQPEDLPGDRA